MEKMLDLWLDEKEKYGIAKMTHHVFGVSYHPLRRIGNGKYTVINQLWYTTYNGARQYFRQFTNNDFASGRMRKAGHGNIRMKNGRIRFPA
ncbi:hypothetical protein GLW03_11155 [Halobacillus halophilus]|uniref:hypothetical protein n=1 Tax=Halobacillus halophilus TaxID=1570 RepID=UPI00136D880A|nr:hypothetical protein [Halobacillus halophilus]MYL30380.1 hypothetical protein [Halobacillus halophilus]